MSAGPLQETGPNGESDAYQVSIMRIIGVSDEYHAYHTSIRRVSEEYQPSIRRVSDEYQTSIRRVLDEYQ